MISTAPLKKDDQAADAPEVIDMRIDVPREALMRAMMICAPHTERPLSPGDLSSFTRIHFSAHKGALRAMATDRYSMAIFDSSVEVPEQTGFALTVAQLKTILSVFAVKKGSTAVVTFSRRSSTEIEVTLGGGWLVGVNSASLVFEQPDLGPGVNLAFAKTLFEGYASTDMFLISPHILRKIPNDTRGCTWRSTEKLFGVIGMDWVVLMSRRTGDPMEVTRHWIGPDK